MNDFWDKKRVLVTGHSGFKGLWLSAILKNFGAEVHGVSFSKENNNHDFYDLNKKDMFHEEHDIDISDPKKIKMLLSDHDFEIIFHLAAQPLVRDSYSSPERTFDINSFGTLNVLEGIRKSKTIKSAVMITTDKCYRNNEWVWGYRESDPLGGHDPYSASKAAAEIIIGSYQKSFFNEKSDTRISSVRAGNVIGGGDFSPDRLLPDLVRAIRDNNKTLLRNPQATRPWQHVLEPLSGYLEVAKKLFNKEISPYESWNFGPRYEDILSVQKVIEIFFDEWGLNYKDFVDYSKKDHPHEAQLLSLDISKASSNLIWRPRMNINETISMVVEWYKTYLDNPFESIEIMHSQINKYFNAYS